MSDSLLIRAWLKNAQLALQAGQSEQAEILLDHLLNSMESEVSIFSSMVLEYALGLDQGITRKGKPNEDFPFAYTWSIPGFDSPISCGLFIVADGMGGYGNGQDAARLLVQAMVEYLLQEASDHLSPEQGPSLLVEAIQRGNRAIFRKNRACGTKMGTTVTAVLQIGEVASIANVGDSRTYILREGQDLKQMTQDHSRVAKLVLEGVITPEEVYTHPERNKVYRSLGCQEQVEVDWYTLNLCQHDRLLLCSDGLWEMVRDPEIAEIMKKDLSAAQMVEHLVCAALRAGGRDNIGVVVVDAKKSKVMEGITEYQQVQAVFTNIRGRLKDVERRIIGATEWGEPEKELSSIYWVEERIRGWLILNGGWLLELEAQAGKGPIDAGLLAQKQQFYHTGQDLYEKAFSFLQKL